MRASPAAALPPLELAASSSSSGGSLALLAAQPQELLLSTHAQAALLGELAEGLEAPVQLAYLVTLMGFLVVGAYLVVRQVCGGAQRRRHQPRRRRPSSPLGADLRCPELPAPGHAAAGATVGRVPCLPCSRVGAWAAPAAAHAEGRRCMRVQVLIRRELEEAAKVLGERVRTGEATSEVREGAPLGRRGQRGAAWREAWAGDVRAGVPPREANLKAHRARAGAAHELEGRRASPVAAAARVPGAGGEALHPAGGPLRGSTLWLWLPGAPQHLVTPVAWAPMAAPAAPHPARMPCLAGLTLLGPLATVPQDYFELGVILLRKKLYTQATKNLEKAQKGWEGEPEELAQVGGAGRRFRCVCVGGGGGGGRGGGWVGVVVVWCVCGLSVGWGVGERRVGGRVGRKSRAEQPPTASSSRQLRRRPWAASLRCRRDWSLSRLGSAGWSAEEEEPTFGNPHPPVK